MDYSLMVPDAYVGYPEEISVGELVVDARVDQCETHTARKGAWRDAVDPNYTTFVVDRNRDWGALQGESCASVQSGYCGVVARQGLLDGREFLAGEHVRLTIALLGDEEKSGLPKELLSLGRGSLMANFQLLAFQRLPYVGCVVPDFASVGRVGGKILDTFADPGLCDQRKEVSHLFMAFDRHNDTELATPKALWTRLVSPAAAEYYSRGDALVGFWDPPRDEVGKTRRSKYESGVGCLTPIAIRLGNGSVLP